MVLNLQFLIILKLGFNTATNSQTVIELEKILKDNMKSCRTYITAAFFFLPWVLPILFYYAKRFS